MDKSDYHFHTSKVEPITSGTVFKTNVTGYLYHWWSGFKSPGPLVRDFDIVEHFKFAGNLFLVKVLNECEFEFRLNGERVIEIVGMSDKGNVISSDARAENVLEEEQLRLALFYREIVDSGSCMRCVGNFSHTGRGYQRFESVDCPLFDDQGKVRFVIGAMNSI